MFPWFWIVVDTVLMSACYEILKICNVSVVKVALGKLRRVHCRAPPLSLTRAVHHGREKCGFVVDDLFAVRDLLVVHVSKSRG
jgi:hypothetical protein